jgi:branched-subunit amino acid aminotransferase/4-amino-4-deoxychorismate lyase
VQDPPIDGQFDLLETLRWTPGDGFYLLERHLRRLQASARYFGFTCSPSRVREVLAAAVGSSDHCLRVRLLVGRDGNARAEHARIEPAAGALRVGIAARPIDPTDPFLYHKTTNRTQQERERSPAYDEVVSWNPHGEITEAITANIVVDLDGRAVTPPVECGLLPGTMRAELLAAGEIAEAPITVEQLLAARRIWLVNSVRGWRQGVVDRSSTPRVR